MDRPIGVLSALPAEFFDEPDEAPSQALRHNQGKPPLGYILTFPQALTGFAEVCSYGEGKYALYNYLKGAPLSQYRDCLLRHLMAWHDGEDTDPESGCSHLDHVVWNALALSQMSRAQPNRDDRPHIVMAAQNATYGGNTAP